MEKKLKIEFTADMKFKDGEPIGFDCNIKSEINDIYVICMEDICVEITKMFMENLSKVMEKAIHNSIKRN